VHELAICQSLLTQVRQIADSHNAPGVERVVVRIGPLSGVEAPLLDQAFTVARAAAGFPKAELEVQISPIRVRCRKCGVESEAKTNALLCGACKSWQVELMSGDEMILQSLVLLEEPAPLVGTG